MVLEDPSDLVRGLRSGDELSWRRFVEGYGGLIYSMVSKAGLDEVDREDLFQETCMKVVRSIHHLKDPYRLASWVTQIAHRLALDGIRRKSRTVSIGGIEGEQAVSDPADTPGVLEEMQRIREAAQLQDALGLLSPKCRRLISMLYFEHPRPSYDEISKRLGIAVGSIGPSRGRCLDKLRRSFMAVSKEAEGRLK